MGKNNVLRVLVSGSKEFDIIFNCGIHDDERDIYIDAIESATSIDNACLDCMDLGASDIVLDGPADEVFTLEVLNP
jgi:hypothetical protein